MLCEFNKSTDKVTLGIHPDKTKILSIRSSLRSETRKEMQVDDIKIEILTRGESVKDLLGPDDLRSGNRRRPK